MQISIITVHPAVTIIESDGRRSEVPTSWFPTTPKPGQTWSISLQHVPTEGEKLEQLNTYLARE